MLPSQPSPIDLPIKPLGVDALPALTETRVENLAETMTAAPAAAPFKRRAIAQRLLVSAAISGVVGDQLLRQGPLGVNMTVYMAVAIITTALAIRLRLGAIPRLTWQFLQIAMLFTLWIGVRSSEPLTLFNVIGAAAAVALAVAGAVAEISPSFMFRLTRVRDVITAVFFTVRNAAIGGFGFLFQDAGTALSVSSVRLYATRIVLRGVILAIGLAAIFAMLLSVGDPVFASAVALPFQWDPKPLVQHAFLIGLFAWPVLGMQWASTIGNTMAPDRQLAILNTEWRGVNRVDLLSILTALNALFAVFVTVQLRVLFGGASYVLETTGLTVAEYARNGFFALLGTSGLVLVTLLVIDATFKDGSIAAWKTSRRLSVSLLLFVGVVLASAATRMALYVNTFGASTERFYCFGIMLWLAVVLILFSRTVLRNNPSHFVTGTLATAWITLLAFNVVNLEGLVTRSNVARFQQGARFDLAYARSLGPDAIPALVQGVVHMPVSELPRVDAGKTQSTCASIGALVDEWTASTRPSDLNWSVSAWRAKKAVALNENALRLRSCPPAPTPATVPLPAPATTPSASPST